MIAALDHIRASKPQDSIEQEPTSASSQSHRLPASVSKDALQVGAVVEYHPPGDKRAITCRIEELEDDRARLEPLANPDIDWVVLSSPLRSSVQGRTEEA
jgi:hypothetical protein